MDERANRVYIYCLDEEYRVVNFMYFVRGAYTDIRTIKFYVEQTRENRNGIKYIYVIDNSYEVYKAAIDAIKGGSVEDRVLFKQLLEKGIRVL